MRKIDSIVHLHCVQTTFLSVYGDAGPASTSVHQTIQRRKAGDKKMRLPLRKKWAPRRKDVCFDHPEALSMVKNSRGGAVTTNGGLRHTIKVLLLFAAWYALNVQYNMVNKKVLNMLPLPWLVAVAQLAVGVVYCGILWATRLRPFPLGSLSTTDWKAIFPIGICHGAGQCATVLSLCAGAVSFTHIVKALEPFFSALVSAVASGVILAPQVYAALIPVVGGVSVAVAKELSFSWLSFGTAMFSNLAFAMRAVYSKLAMGNASLGLSAPNLYGVVTLTAFIVMTPIALVMEVPKFRNIWAAAVSEEALAPTTPKILATKVLLSGLFHYLNNEMMYFVLGEVHPITLAVGNTLKRTVLIVASLIVFQNPITPTAAVGSTVAMLGVLVYSLTKAHYDKKAAQ